MTDAGGGLPLEKARPGDPGVLQVALGATGWTRAFKAAGWQHDGVRAEFAEIAPISRAFAPMVREQRFDVSEMALFTYLQARAWGKPVVLLPVAVAARFQEAALWCRADDDAIAGPADLAGSRVGIRAYGQTTGAWLRGVLADDFGVAADAIRWTTFEPAHVAEYADPPWAERAPPGSDMLGMLRDGALDAVIVGNDAPDDPALRRVFPDPEAAGRRFLARHGFMPLNHLVVARRPLVDARSDLIGAFAAALGAAVTAAGFPLDANRAALDPSISLALRYAFDQGLLPRTLTLEDVWSGSPAGS